MMAVTVGGQAGAGGLEVGRLVAKRIDGQYVQKQAIRRVARQLNASAEAVVRKELAYHKRWSRLGHKLELWLSHIGRTWAGDPWGMPSAHTMAAQVIGGRKELPAEISDSDYKQAVFENARRYLGEGNIVLAHRAGCLTLRDRNEAVHVGLFASKDDRIARAAWRYRIGRSDAEDWVETMDSARAAWFKELADQDPHDRSIYDFAIDVDRLGEDDAVASRVAEMTMEKRFGVLAAEHQTLPA